MFSPYVLIILTKDIERGSLDVNRHYTGGHGSVPLGIGGSATPAVNVISNIREP